MALDKTLAKADTRPMEAAGLGRVPIDCPHQGCQFDRDQRYHDFIMLDGWVGGISTKLSPRPICGRWKLGFGVAGLTGRLTNASGGRVVMHGTSTLRLYDA